MGVSGALAGMVAMNELAGVSGRLILEYAGGAGFTGIAVALMGRNHPGGIVAASAKILKPTKSYACGRKGARECECVCGGGEAHLHLLEP